MMRTTLTLDDDVSARLRDEMAQEAKTFRDTVNDLIREGLAAKASRRSARPPEPLPTKALRLRPGLSLDSIPTLLAVAEGEDHR